jgi:hypothetical protein
MQDLIVALYDDHATAVKVRTELVKDGFPTDRVELTSTHEHRQVEKGPAEAFENNVRDYFRTLSTEDAPAGQLEQFVQAVIAGASAITLHPRGEEEIQRGEKILGAHGPRDVYRYLPDDAGHTADRKIERAAMPPERGAPGRQ